MKRLFFALCDFLSLSRILRFFFLLPLLVILLGVINPIATGFRFPSFPFFTNSFSTVIFLSIILLVVALMLSPIVILLAFIYNRVPKTFYVLAYFIGWAVIVGWEMTGSLFGVLD